MSRIGKTIIRGLREFNDSLKRGEDVTKKFTWRRVVLDTKTSSYDGKLVKKTRGLLGASQSVFARFLGVSVKTVQSWEKSKASPAKWLGASWTRFEPTPSTGPNAFTAWPAR